MYHRTLRQSMSTFLPLKHQAFDRRLTFSRVFFIFVKAQFLSWIHFLPNIKASEDPTLSCHWFKLDTKNSY